MCNIPTPLLLLPTSSWQAWIIYRVKTKKARPIGRAVFSCEKLAFATYLVSFGITLFGEIALGSQWTVLALFQLSSLTRKQFANPVPIQSE